MSGFITGLQQLKISKELQTISTGSLELDEIIGGIRRDLFYLFYGETPLIESLFQHILTNALDSYNKKEHPVVVYMICGNYRRERIDIGIDPLMELIEASGYNTEEALRRIYIFTASSADQQGLLIDELETLIEKGNNISLVLVRGIFKLYNDDARTRDRHVVAEEIQKSIIRLRQTCASHNIPLVASGREQKSRRLLPHPEASSFLKHLANVIIYLRERGKEGQYNRAFVLKTPTRHPCSIEYTFEVNENLGRITPPFRLNFNERIEKLRRDFQTALMNQSRREAFDRLVDAWTGELGAMSYAETVKILDLMLLVGLLDNRSIIEELRQKYIRLESRLNNLDNRYEYKS